ncbi:MAG: conserved hypothetical signal peptide protein [Moraxellaceae bacterium]|nr:conserved hypothetical signal peptide protein [Moraxellaceae bacterium]
MNIPTALPPSIMVLLLAAAPAWAAPPAATPGVTAPGTGMTMHNPDTLAWEAVPPVLPAGAQLTVLDGDPFKTGPYTLRLMMPAGYQIPPHWHSRPENVTVISGTLFIGMGDLMDPGAAQELQTGGFHAIPARVHHFAYSPNGAVVQIHGEGPFDITYMNPADNPEPNARSTEASPRLPTPGTGQ